MSHFSPTKSSLQKYNPHKQHHTPKSFSTSHFLPHLLSLASSSLAYIYIYAVTPVFHVLGVAKHMSRLLMLATTATMEEEMLEEQGESRRVVRLEQEVLIHIQVRRIKQEDEKARGLLQRLQLLEMRPTATAVIGFRELARPPSPSPLRRAGQAISVGD